MNRNTLRTIALCLALVITTKAFETGAPAGVCDSLTPQHGVDAQTSAFPYSLTATKVGSQLAITLKTKTATDSFKGFILQVRDSNNKPIGIFSATPEAKFVDCAPGKKNALTHTSPKEKKEIKATWTSPANYKGSVYAIATVARNGEVFWVGQKSAVINLAARQH